MSSLAYTIVILIAAALHLGYAHEGHDHSETPASLIKYPLDVIQNETSLTTFTLAIANAGIEGSLVLENKPYTILAPSNAAFRNLTMGFLQSPRLGGVLAFHIIPGQYPVSSLNNGANLTTLTGLSLRVQNGANVTFVGGANSATITVADITAGQSVIHIVDNVLDSRSNTATSSPAQTLVLNRLNTTRTNSSSALAPSPSDSMSMSMSMSVSG